jgi:LPS export ABC transporter protein LptC
MAAPGPPKPPGFEFQATRLKVMDPRTGRAVWEISLAKAETASETGETWLTGISASYHNPDGTTSSLTSGRAHLGPDGRVLEFSGQVRLSAPNGGALSSETLRWESGTEQFTARAAAGGQVSFQRDGTALRAPEFQGDMALKRVRAAGGAKLTGGE